MEFTPKQLKEVSLKSENESEAAKEEGAVQAVDLLQNLRDDQSDDEMQKEAIQQLMLRSLITMNEAHDFLECQPRSQFKQLMRMVKADVGAICKMKMEKEMKERAENLSILKGTITKLMAKNESIQKKFAPKQLKEVSETESEAAKEEGAVHDDQADVEILKKIIQQLMLISLSTMDEAYDFLACHLRNQLTDTDTQLMSLSKTDVGAIYKMKMEKEMKERAENLSKLKDTITNLMAKKESIEKKFAPKQLNEVSLKSETESEAAKEDAGHDDQAYFEMQTEAILHLMLLSLNTMNEAVDFLACQPRSQLTESMRLSKTDVGAICKMKMEKEMKERAENLSKLKDTITKLMAKKENIQEKFAPKQLEEVSLKSETESEAAKEGGVVHDDQADVEMLKEIMQQLMLISLSTMNEAVDFLACQPRSQLTQLMSLIKTDVGAICKTKMEKEMKERAETLSKLKDTITKLMAKKENIQKKFAPKQLKEVSLKSETGSEAAKEDAVHDDQAYFEMQTEAIQQLMLISLSTMNEAVDFLACTHRSQLTQLMSLSKTDVGASCKMKMEKNMKERAENFSKLKDTITELMAKKESIQKKMAENSLL